jgi:curved DNA-binding protein CbpA
MRDPYLILGLDPEADDDAVERAYHEGIRRCPPERDAERFAAIRAAYEQLRTHRDRLAHELFDTTPPDSGDVLEKAAPVGSPARPGRDVLEALLRGDG